MLHACGHDIHTAALLGVAKISNEHREDIHGTIVILHQHAEEMAPGGAQAMVKDGCLEGVDEVYGAHVHSSVDLGQMELNEGYIHAAADTFYITIQGKGGQGAEPHDTIDSIALGSQLVVDLQ